MRIVVCVKAVRSEYVKQNVDAVTSFILNPYDLLTLQYIVTLKKQFNLQIITLCMGPLAAEEVLTRTIALGADDAVLVTDKVFAGSDTFATSYILAKALEKLQPVDMYICGKRAVDGETGQIGNSLACRLEIPCITGVHEIFTIDNSFVTIKRQTDIYNETVQCKLPVVLVFQNFSTREDYLSLISLKRAKKQKIKKWDAEYINADKKYCGQEGSKTKVINVKSIQYMRQSRTVAGTAKDKAKVILDLVKRQGNGV